MFGTVVGQKLNAMFMKVDLINRSFSIVSDGIEENRKGCVDIKLINHDKKPEKI